MGGAFNCIHKGCRWMRECSSLTPIGRDTLLQKRVVL